MSKQDRRKKKVQHLAKISTVDIGETTQLNNCCREVRLGATNLKVGEILTGYNTLSDSYEEWEVVDARTDSMNSIVKRIR